MLFAGAPQASENAASWSTVPKEETDSQVVDIVPSTDPWPASRSGPSPMTRRPVPARPLRARVDALALLEGDTSEVPVDIDTYDDTDGDADNTCVSVQIPFAGQNEHDQGARIRVVPFIS